MCALLQNCLDSVLTYFNLSEYDQLSTFCVNLSSSGAGLSKFSVKACWHEVLLDCKTVVFRLAYKSTFNEHEQHKRSKRARTA